MNKLNIFVSSTCYDLSQVRVDMSDFIENSGHNPILSESTSFPINPSKSTLDNCIDAVKDHADILVLIVGNRYGSKIPTGKSITNTEYLTAKSKGIPIYVFIKSEMISVLPIWNKNKDGDFSEYVDSSDIFEFISELRTNSKIWTFEFKHAQDIILTLKDQLSYLFKSSLILGHKIKSEIGDFEAYDISNEAIKLILEKPDNFEARFFLQNIIDNLLKRQHLKNDYEYKLIFNYKYSIRENRKILDWLQDRISLLSDLANSISTIVNVSMPYYYGEPGIPSDLKGLYYVAEAYSRVVESIFIWYSETMTTKLNDECQEIKETMANLAKPLINDFWEFPFDCMNTLMKALENKDVKTLNLQLDVKLDEYYLTKFAKDMAKLKQVLIDDL